MKKFFAVLAVCLLTSNAFAGIQSELVSARTTELTVGIDRGTATEYTYKVPEGTVFTQKVFQRALPNNMGSELCFEASNGEFFRISCYTQLDINNVSCSTEAPQAKPVEQTKGYKIYFSDAYQSVLVVFSDEDGKSRMVKVILS